MIKHYFKNTLLGDYPLAREFEIIHHKKLSYPEYLEVAYKRFTKEKMHKVLVLSNEHYRALDPIYQFKVEKYLTNK